MGKKPPQPAPACGLVSKPQPLAHEWPLSCPQQWEAGLGGTAVPPLSLHIQAAASMWGLTGSPHP